MTNVNSALQAGRDINIHNSTFNQIGPGIDIKNTCLQSLAFRNMKSRAGLQPSAPGTGSWILGLDEYRSWKEKGGTLWIKGRAGCGKSTLMEHVIETERGGCNADTKIVSFFFHSGGEDEQRAGSSLGLYRSICFQLLENDEKLLSRFVEITKFEERQSKQGPAKEKWVWKESELHGFLMDHLRNNVRRGARILLYIDALDEAGTETAHSLTKLFRTLLEVDSGTLGICVASRPYSEGGGRVFGKDSPPAINLEQSNGQDIQAFVDNEFSTFQNRPDPDGIREVRDRLVEKANGIFQWLKWSTPKALELLDDTNDEDEPASYVLKVIEGYPQGLEALYERILSSIDERPEVALRLFECLAMALGPLSAEDMRMLVCMDPYQGYDTMEKFEASIHFCERREQFRARVHRLSRGLIRRIVLPKSSSHEPKPVNDVADDLTLQFDHDSVEEYMLEKGLGVLEKRLHQPSVEATVGVDQRHLRMAMKCLQFLQLSEVAKYEKVEYNDGIDDEGFGSENDISWRMPLPAEPPPPLTRYAALHWFEHARQAEKNENLREVLVHYLQQFTKAQCASLLAAFQDAATDVRNEDWTLSNLTHVLSFFGLAESLRLHIERMKDRGSAVDELEAINWFDDTPLMTAALMGNGSTMRMLLESGEDAASRNSCWLRGGTALHCAAIQGYYHSVSNLLEHPGIDVNAGDYEGCTAFARACSCSSLQIVELLASVTECDVFSKDADRRPESMPRPWKKDEVQWQVATPLFQAWKSPALKIFKFLLGRGRPGDVRETQGQHSLLHMVVAYSHRYVPFYREKFDLLVDSGKFDLNFGGDDGESPLFTAVRHRNYYAVACLLRLGPVDANIATITGDTPLALGLRMGDRIILELLLYSSKIDPLWQSYTDCDKLELPIKWAGGCFGDWSWLPERLEEKTPQEKLEAFGAVYTRVFSGRRLHPALLP